MDELATSQITIKSEPEKSVSKNITIGFSIFKLIYDISTKNQLNDKAKLVYKYYEPLFMEKYDDFNKRKRLDIL